MARTVCVIGLEPGSGKSAVLLGLVEVLSRHAGRIAFLRPLVAAADPPDPDVELVRHHLRLPQDHAASYALTADELHGPEGRATLVTRVLDAHAALAREADLVVVEGSDLTSASITTEIELVLETATHLGAAVVLVVGGHRRAAAEVLDAVAQQVDVLAEHGCTVLAVVANRVAPDVADAVRAGLPAVASACVTAVLPEVPMLAAPTVREVADRLGAEALTDADPAREVSRVIVGAMGLPAFLGRLAGGDLVLTPGDRADVVAGSLAAHVSGTYPAVAGLVLTGGVVDPAVRRLAAGLGAVGVPVVAVGTDTYDTATAVRGVRGAIRPGAERKIATAIALFEDHVDHEELRQRLAVARPARTTPLMFEQTLLERARAGDKHVVLPEGTDDRVLRAAEQLVRRGVARLTLLGPEEEVRARADAVGVHLPGVPVIDPATSPLRERFAREYAELRKHKGVGMPLALDTMADVSYFGTMMIHQGLADGMVSGAAHTTAHTIRPSFEIIRTAPGVSLVSSAFGSRRKRCEHARAEHRAQPDPDGVGGPQPPRQRAVGHRPRRSAVVRGRGRRASAARPSS